MATPRPLPRGWKPFKAILKGSKLYLYKPPTSSISYGVKELFATSLTSTTEQEELERVSPTALNQHRPAVPPPRRLYWGHGRHPELIPKIDKDTPVEERKKLEKGTGDALVHETVFGTSFDGKLFPSYVIASHRLSQRARAFGGMEDVCAGHALDTATSFGSREGQILR